jgi:hypothetical protein
LLNFFIVKLSNFFIVKFLNHQILLPNPYHCPRIYYTMPKISTKGEAMPSSPIRKLVPYAEAAKKTGAKVYHLNIGQPDLETPPQFWEKLRTMDMKVLAYCPSDGFESL